MATTATITPTLGSAPVTLQAGNYSAIDDRRFWGAGLQEGAVSGGSYQVIQRAAGANMTVDVASSVGEGAIVQGDSVTGQGRYFVPQTPSNVNVDIAAADATNPRNDLVVLEIKDDQHDAGGLNLARVRVITGTANASATLADAPGANGTPALPSSCMLLAVVRVAAGATSIGTAAISDRRLSANPSANSGGLLIVRDEKAANTDGGTFTAGSWQTRTLNTTQTNTISGASLASNQVTLPPGTYYIDASAPGYRVDRHKLALFNVSASTYDLIGTSEFAYNAAGSLGHTTSYVRGVITITLPRTYELRHYCGTTGTTTGFGLSSNFDNRVEVYAQLTALRMG